MKGFDNVLAIWRRRLGIEATFRLYTSILFQLKKNRQKSASSTTKAVIFHVFERHLMPFCCQRRPFVSSADLINLSLTHWALSDPTPEQRILTVENSAEVPDNRGSSVRLHRFQFLLFSVAWATMSGSHKGHALILALVLAWAKRTRSQPSDTSPWHCVVSPCSP